MKINSISTPALILDETTYRANIDKMKELLCGKKIKLRPHYKSHKCASIAHQQIKDGAIGMTCAKLEEAVDLADSGIENILIANQITDPKKIARLAVLAGDCYLTVCVDNEENVIALSKAAEYTGNTIHCLIEYEIGMKRCGVANTEDVLKLAKLIKALPKLSFDGIQAYAGHISHEVSFKERKTATEANFSKLENLINYLKENGIEVKTVSGGSTGTAEIKANSPMYTELQAGSYLFMDSTYKELDLPFKNSLFILTTVVSVSENIVVVDAGVKSCGIDQGMPECCGFEVSSILASEEHLQLHNPTKKFKIGDKILLVPGHCCSTVNLHNVIYLVNKELVIDRIPITARGFFK